MGPSRNGVKGSCLGFPIHAQIYLLIWVREHLYRSDGYLRGQMEMKTLYRVQPFIAFMEWEKRGKRWGERGVPQPSANSIWSELARKEQGWGPSPGDADTSTGPTPLGRPPTSLLA